MAFTGNYMPTSFKVGLLNGVFSFTPGTGDGYYIALYTNLATFDSTTSAYTSTNEVASGGGYTTGGNLLTVAASVPAPLGPTWTSGNTTAYINFSDTTWTTATITARGALIYKNSTVTIGGGAVVKPVIAVLDFGSDKSSSASNFTIQFPAVGSSPAGSTAILRIA
jgi:hypothetical protein